MATLTSQSSRAIRDELRDLIVKELMGPAGGPDEEVTEKNVRGRYLAGMLAPVKYTPDEEELNEELELRGEPEGEDGTSDAAVPMLQSLFPSSFGMTFCVDGAATALTVTARWGRYDRAESAGDPQARVWKRTPVEAAIPRLELREGPIAPAPLSYDHPDVVIRGVARRHEGDWLVTLFLVNCQVEPKRSKDSAWLFQAEMAVEHPEGAQIFAARPPLMSAACGEEEERREERALDMMYRKDVEFAVGHGVSVHAETAQDAPTRAVRLSTCVIPSHEVPRTASADASALGGLVLDMSALADPSFSPEALTPLVSSYASWIDAQQARLGDPSSNLAQHGEAASDALAACRKALSRIEEGIGVLGGDPLALEAFRFMNRAMALQRTHGLFAERVRRGEQAVAEELDVPENHTWYPFQLAFVLINLPALTDPLHPDRRTDTQAAADLLWFPTGGGKTEAYLGLAAYAMAMKRLQKSREGLSSEHGIAVLMRYTLRLLTIQQFQRAAGLVCACETIRRQDEERWGRVPFRLGLWVGERTTPNRTADSDDAVRSLRGRYQPHFASAGAGKGSPAQLTNCPWCGKPIDPGRHIRVETFQDGRGRTFLYCGDDTGLCPFSDKGSKGEGLPVVVVDEEIYRNPPSILIATVDKFAQMPWRGAVQTLFGRVEKYCERHGFKTPDLADADSHPARGSLKASRSTEHPHLRPPDLIIQDELHLISGPLGSLVGLYETAVDFLSSWKVQGVQVRPKVIASTATIRRARDQVHSLFTRKVEIFPPHGLDAGDNFFSHQIPPDAENPGRLYIGVCSPGNRLKQILVAIYVAGLAASHLLYEKYGPAADPWMTLVGYFNTLRELGGMRRLVDDQVGARLARMEQRGFGKRRIWPYTVEELTSRKSSTEIPHLLDRVEHPFVARLQQSEERKKKSKVLPLDVLLATNMISVGVDVRRLGLMAVAGQPKNSAEYIQATSRVGRTWPGLVITAYNWARPRDLSHYEHFEHYHATFYKHVEALSVTPFSSRALDRGLSAVLVSCIRQGGLQLNPNEAAMVANAAHPAVQEASGVIARRVWDATADVEVRDQAVSMVKKRMDDWSDKVQKVSTGGRLGYQASAEGGVVNLLRKPGPDKWETFTCLNSLRDVEPSVHLVLDERNMDG